MGAALQQGHIGLPELVLGFEQRLLGPGAFLDLGLKLLDRLSQGGGAFADFLFQLLVRLAQLVLRAGVRLHQPE